MFILFALHLGIAFDLPNMANPCPQAGFHRQQYPQQRAPVNSSKQINSKRYIHIV